AIYGRDGLAPTSVPGWYRSAEGIIKFAVNSPAELMRILDQAPRIVEFDRVLRAELKKHNISYEAVLDGKAPDAVYRLVEQAFTRAAYAAREVTTNFGLAGQSERAQLFMRAVP